MRFSLERGCKNEEIQRFRKSTKHAAKMEAKMLPKSMKSDVRRPSKKVLKNRPQKTRKMTPMDLQMGTHFRCIFGHLASLCCLRQALGAKMIPKASPRAPETSPSFNFHRFSVDLDGFSDDLCMSCGLLFASLPSWVFLLP